MHDEARQFLNFVSQLFPYFFSDRTVLDVGSGDINGNNRNLFNNCVYHGNDLIEGPNVTVISKTSTLPFEDNSFDTIISSECFEHDPEYKLSLQKIYSMLKPNGLFLFTCASTGRAEHGTLQTSPYESFGTIGNISGWQEYYKNLTFEDIDEVLDVKNSFSSYASYYNPVSKDLYFWGIKKFNVLDYSNFNSDVVKNASSNNVN